ncbi:efflux transporter outer membrane subunit [Collimonas sp. OK412]|jgi:NodT family efflux transporter outer membrane factor (OMF) lipoprotein|uniref:efflux transporter outer membrane subunit n=1 Tax=Collimonas sp. (strain OK412) TaxID=1801619 RepID=UPI0008E4B1AA|nr:efflux transporter outer membrane subunit [Collimonas sp. OK412]SFB70163.1 efflux transporter, outer membrane factor (OMF) lipoprotein, NodT family [Collimonas sp. OK412]
MPHPYFPPSAALSLRGIASMCVLALSISGCASFSEIGPRAEPKDISSYQSGHLLAGNAVKWPDDNWWTIYGDRQLDALIAEGLKGAPSLAAAQARLMKAQGVAQQQGAALLPQVSANASADYMKQSYNNGVPPEFVPQNYNVEGKATLNLSYEIDFWGKNRAALAAATSDLEAARADAAQARIALATSIAAAYAEFERLLSQHDTAQEALQVRIQTLDLFEQRRLNGLETLGSVKQVLARKASAEADLLSLDESIALQRNKLAALVGAGPDRGLSLQRPVLDLSKPFVLPSQLPVNLLGRRPDVVAARLRAEAAAKQIKVAKAQFYPNVNLTAYLGFQSLGLGMLTKAGSDISSIGPAISLPIFEGGRLRGQYRQASGSYDEAVANYDGAVTQALQDVADAAVSEKALSGRLGKVQEAVDAAAAAAQIAQNRYAGGLATYLDVLNAQDTLLTSQRDLSTLRSRMFALDVQLVRALGGGYRQAAI